MMNKVMRRLVTMAVAGVMFFGVAPMVTEAKMGNYNFVSIQSGAVDSVTVNGVTVEAVYKAYGSGYDADKTYSCAAFVKKFYRQVFGRSVWGLNDTGSVPLMDKGEFTETKNPKVGDILRDNKNVHWAIVKEINGSTVTVIQQNAWNSEHTKAWVGATVDVNDSGYSFFTWDGNKNDATGGSAVAPDFSFQYHDQEVYDTNAVAHAKVSNPERLEVQQVGCYVWDAAGNELTKHDESCYRNESKFNIWYDFTSELGLTLTPGTNYSYQFYVVYGGVEYAGEKQYFTTTGTAVKKELPKEEYIIDGLMVMQSGLGRSEDYMWNELGDPVKTEGNTKYYKEGSNGLFGTFAPLAVEFENGAVKSITWKYTYSDSSYLNESENFYQKLVIYGGAAFRQDGTGICKNPGNETTTWEGIAEVRRDVEKEIPTITVKIEGLIR